MMLASNGLWWSALLGVVVMLLFALPLVPAWWELHRPQDDARLDVPQDQDRHITHFAQAFGQRVAQRWQQRLDALAPQEQQQLTWEQRSCILLGPGARWLPEALLRGGHDRTVLVPELLLAAGHLQLPGHTRYLAEIYARGDVTGAAQVCYSALLALGRVTLARQSVVQSWVHAHGILRVGAASQLQGRASSAQGMELEEGIAFAWLHAPRIQTLPVSVLPRQRCNARPSESLPRFEPLRADDLRHGRWLSRQSLEIPPNQCCGHDLVVHGDLRVGAGCSLRGSAKSRGRLEVAPHAFCAAALVACGVLEIGPGAQVAGPVISETLVLLRSGSCIGSAASATTVSAPRIWLEPGSTVHGSLRAREQGLTLAALRASAT